MRKKKESKTKKPAKKKVGSITRSKNKEQELVKRIKEEVKKMGGKVNQIDFKKHILDIDCPPENEVACGLAIQKILNEDE